MQRIYFVNLPKYEADTIPLSIAILQTVANNCGYDALFTDLNLELDQAKDSSKELMDVWSSDLKGNVTYSAVKKYFLMCDKIIDKIIEYKPAYIGFSFFSQYSITYGNAFLRRLKTRKCNIKTIVGGPGISRAPVGKVESWHEDKLVDYYVIGDGEVCLEKMLKNQLPYAGVNNREHVPIPRMDDLPFPDLNGFELSRYPLMFNKRTVAIEGSRGCVRDCGFCDIKVLFLKYRYKTGKRLFDEIMHSVKNHDAYTFWFTDSLVNGNQKEFRIMLNLLADYNRKSPENKKITWTGQYIVRPQKQYIKEDFRMLVDSGCSTLATGIESYSESVRRELSKSFSNDDIRWFFSQCQTYGISLFIMMVIGYPTETEQDFQDTLSFFDEFEHLADDNTITGVQLGHTMILIPGTPAWKKAQQYGITYQQSLPNVNKNNTWQNENSNLKVRMKRRLLAQKKALQKGFGIRSMDEHMHMFKRWMHDV